MQTHFESVPYPIVKGEEMSVFVYAVKEHRPDGGCHFHFAGMREPTKPDLGCPPEPLSIEELNRCRWELSHRYEGVTSYAPPRSDEHHRELLIEIGVLPPPQERGAGSPVSALAETY